MNPLYDELFEDDDLSFLSPPVVREINTRDIAITPYLTLNLARPSAPHSGRVSILDVFGMVNFVIGGIDLLKPTLAAGSHCDIECDVYEPGQLVFEGGSEEILFGLQDSFHGEENELWSYVRPVNRDDWAIAETFRQTIRTVQAMRKAVALFEAQGEAAPNTWSETLKRIADDMPEAWDEDFAHLSQHPVDKDAWAILYMCRKAVRRKQ